MNAPQTLVTRLIAATAAAATTVLLFSAVISIAPQHEMSELMARAAAPDASRPATALAPAPLPADRLLALNVE